MELCTLYLKYNIYINFKQIDVHLSCMQFKNFDEFTTDIYMYARF